MGNRVTQQSRRVELWCDRPVVIITESNHADFDIRGLMIGPVGMTYAVALTLLDQAFLAAAAREGWQFDDVLAEMASWGFDSVKAAIWDDQYASDDR